jgi:hypothetical protein
MIAPDHELAKKKKALMDGLLRHKRGGYVQARDELIELNDALQGYRQKTKIKVDSLKDVKLARSENMQKYIDSQVQIAFAKADLMVIEESKNSLFGTRENVSKPHQATRPAPPCPALPHPALPCFALPCPAIPRLTLLCPAPPFLASPFSALPRHSSPHPSLPCPAIPSLTQPTLYCCIYYILCPTLFCITHCSLTHSLTHRTSTSSA